MEGRAFTEAEARALWRQHCAPLLASGHAVLYGSEAHLQRIAAREAKKAGEGFLE